MLTFSISYRGGFKILDTATPGEFYGGFLAQPPCRVHRKAYELSQKIPPVLQVNLLQQYQLQADLFQNGCLDLCDIALYFFPVDYMERCSPAQNFWMNFIFFLQFQFRLSDYYNVFFECRSQNYNRLFQLMANKNSVMISYIDGVELLIFTSKQLPADSRGKSLDYLIQQQHCRSFVVNFQNTYSVHSLKNLVKVVEYWYKQTFCSKLSRVMVGNYMNR